MNSKRPVPPAHIVDRALKRAEEGWSGADIDRELGLQAKAGGHEIVEISDGVISEIIRKLFGSNAKIESSTRLTPLATHGIQRRGGFTGNLVYKLVLERPRRSLVLRFNRGLREDVYAQEQENYAAVQRATGIRGPEILHVDRSQLLAPSEFMVMEHIEGELASYLTHPNNPELNQAEKRRIRHATGDFYAALHAQSQPAGDDMHETRRLLFGLYRLLEVATPASSSAVRACIDAFRATSALRSNTEALCFMDAELLFVQQAGHWDPTYVCDLEWAGYRDRYADLVAQLCPSEGLWSLPSPGVPAAAVLAARSDPFFQAYQQRHEVDWPRLTSIVPHYQLSLWGHALADQPTAAARATVLRLRGELLTTLMQQILR